MELRHIESFIAVAEELNFRRAAERLHVAQPPLSQQIKRLERDVGATLLFRTTRHVALTPAGEAFLYEARRAVQGAHAARRAAREVAAGRTGVVRLGFSGPASYEVLMLLTKMYRMRRPQVRLDVVGPVYGSDLAERLSHGEIDASLARLPVQGSRIAVREIVRQDMAVALPADHSLADRPFVKLHDLSDEPVISYSEEHRGAVPSVVQTAFREHGFSPNVIQSAPDMHAIMSLVGGGAGIGFVPLSVSHIKVPGVVLVPVPEIPPLPLALAWSEDDVNPALAALIDIIDDVSASYRAGQ
ncbi:LysR substrate-binding domain-containing protein [Streptomyces sp. NPDC005077]|uniref:LysR substrate-binding domain-containing protein n=1 Tax=Streptomyces sp. NPDC005077 TaxID=3154292 RepID=UPI0033ADF3E8